MEEATNIGPYRVLEPLGHGGMGVVYRARHISSDQAVALKTVRVPSPPWFEGIRREIHALTRIRHPGVVRIVDHGVHQGRPWYAMDLLEGESLHRFGQRIWSPFRRSSFAMDLLSVSSTELVSETQAGGDLTLPMLDFPGPESGSGPVDGRAPAAAGYLDEVLYMMRRVCASLAFLHGEGVINCDLKPSNIVLVDGFPVIIDFGLAAQYPGAYGREALESQRSMSGTLPYMAPEQIRGELADARSDLYAIGCLLYELVVGNPPFTGAPRQVMTQHLTAAPVPPSELVADLPRELERVMLKLLEKDLSNRFGFADEVAAALADISGDVHRLRDFPPARSYLYRPQFVGRSELVGRVSKLRDRAARGSGAFVLLGGESGVGKTRFALELTRLVPGSSMQVVTSQASSLSTESAAAVGPAPLHALRPLLQAIADHCQEGGPEVTDRLLGPRRSVLSLYEPLLLHVPADGSLPPPIPLSLDASRQRLFSYLSDTLSAFAIERPVLLVLDDIGWADELSIAFLQSLTESYLERTPVFVLCTYRTEEANEAVASLSSLPHILSVTLPRLDESAVRSMMSDMLAVRELPDPFVQFVAREAEGNPFFVAEYLRTAVTERVLYRDQHNSWQLRGHDTGTPSRYETLPLPGSLRELIGQRLQSLTPAAQQANLAAAVLGREPDLEILREVAALTDEASVSAVDELLRRQILEQLEPGRLRYAHDKLREVTYSSAPKERVRDLHARAALAFESRWRDRADASRFWATLGHHFAAAKHADRAAHYLKLAADHARSIYANREAIRLYREAINQVNELLLRLADDSARGGDSLIDLYESLGDVHALIGQREEARTAYEDALARTHSDDVAMLARLYRKLGKTWETQHQHEKALHQYDRAHTVLGLDPANTSHALLDEWIDVRLDQLTVYYWLDRVPEMDALTRELRPYIGEHASPRHRSKFFDTQTKRNLRRDRYVITEETLNFARAELEACREGRDIAALVMAQFGLGFVLVLHGQLDAGSAELQRALELAEKGGDLAQQARCLTYLTLAARLAGGVERAKELADRAVDIAVAVGMRDYLAAARANQAWICHRVGDSDSALRFAKEALDIWSSLSLVFPFQWMALSPVLALALQQNDLNRAMACVGPLLDERQQSLPGPVADALGRAGRSWGVGNQDDARAALELALTKLEQAHFL